MLTNKKRLSIILLGALLVVLCATYLIFFHKGNSANEQSGTKLTDGVNLNPPTEDERKQAELNKEKNDQLQNGNRQQSDGSKQSVTPVISVADSSGSEVEVAAVIAELFEKDGTCTVSLSKNEVITRQVSAVAEGRSTYCPIVKVPKDEFKLKGAWKVEVTYESSFSKGKSEAREVIVN